MTSKCIENNKTTKTTKIERNAFTNSDDEEYSSSENESEYTITLGTEKASKTPKETEKASKTPKETEKASKTPKETKKTTDEEYELYNKHVSELENAKNNRQEVDNKEHEFVDNMHAKNPVAFTNACMTTKNSFKCTRRNCTFAHFMGQLVVQPCKYAENCKTKKATCKFTHPGEERSDWENRTRTVYGLPLTQTEFPVSTEKFERPKYRDSREPREPREPRDSEPLLPRINNRQPSGFQPARQEIDNPNKVISVTLKEFAMLIPEVMAGKYSTFTIVVINN